MSSLQCHPPPEYRSVFGRVLLYQIKKSELPIMVMELMGTSLASFVRSNQSKVTLDTKMSILHDVSLGLSYLHARKPAIVHRDLSPNNVMLTSHLVAKIGDLGVAKVIRADSRQTRSRLTTAPGTVDFMPPETLEANRPVYGTAVDVFSFAGIALHVFAEEWPTPSGLKKRDPVTKRLLALTEAERRQEYLNKIPENATVLKGVFERCLDDDPDERPPIQEVSEMIELLKVAIYVVAAIVLIIDLHSYCEEYYKPVVLPDQFNANLRPSYRYSQQLREIAHKI